MQNELFHNFLTFESKRRDAYYQIYLKKIIVLKYLDENYLNKINFVCKITPQKMIILKSWNNRKM